MGPQLRTLSLKNLKDDRNGTGQSTQCHYAEQICQQQMAILVWWIPSYTQCMRWVVPTRTQLIS